MESQSIATDRPPLIGESPLFQQVLAVVDAVARNDCVVLIEGESGTGKELIARRIHQRSARRDAPFIPVNCAGISESLFESQFYGHLRGAFTGATDDTLGMVRAADGGTLLLDEVGELPLHLQPKLLRVIQEREVAPVGASRPVAVDVRFVASTNRSLAKSVSDGSFRSDLYHRLNIVRVHIPPLRNRPQDVDLLLSHYVRLYAEQYNATPRAFSDRLRQRLRQYPWPGNVRELCAYIERLYAADLPPMPPTMGVWEDGYAPAAQEAAPDRPCDPAPPSRMADASAPPADPCLSLAEAEAQAIRQALEATGYNRSAASRLLNIHRTTLLRKIRLLGL